MAETWTWFEQAFRFRLVPVSHSVPQGAGVAFDTPEGIVVHSGDFKLDPTPIDGVPTDLPIFAELGRQGVRLLHVRQHQRRAARFRAQRDEPGQADPRDRRRGAGPRDGRLFRQPLHRVQQIVDAAVDAGRTSRSWGDRCSAVCRSPRPGCIWTFRRTGCVAIEELLKLPPNKTEVISTGSQGEPFAALSLMACGSHKLIKIEQGDTVLISAKPIPGNETACPGSSPACSRPDRCLPRQQRHGARVGPRGPGGAEDVHQRDPSPGLRAGPRRVPAPARPCRPGHGHAGARGVPLADGDAVVLEDGEAGRAAGRRGRLRLLDGIEVGDVRGACSGTGSISPRTASSSSPSASSSRPVR